eukprot:2343468-Amphidinium_carterae.1
MFRNALKTPVLDSGQGGRMAPAPLMLLRPGEEDWRDVFDRLKDLARNYPYYILLAENFAI